MGGFTLSAVAEEDLIQVYLDGATHFGLDQASRYHQHLIQVFQFLADNPLAGPIRSELQDDIRVHPSASHVILYTVREHDILVLRIRHGREDWLDR